MAELERSAEAPAGPRPVPGPSQPSVAAEGGGAAVMSLVDHLTELRNRLFKTLLALVVATFFGFFVANPLVDQLTKLAHNQFQIIGIGGAFFITLKMALVVGVAVSLPVAVYQLWRFVAPGLTPRERDAVRPWLPLAGLFFAVGAVVAYLVLPFALGFLGGFAFDNTVYQPSLESFFNFALLMFFAFGLVMEFPIALVVLAKVGVLPLDRLRANRRYAFLVIVIFAVVITPGGDPISPTVMSAVMYVLFELTIRLLARSESRAAGRHG